MKRTHSDVDLPSHTRAPAHTSLADAYRNKQRGIEALTVDQRRRAAVNRLKKLLGNPPRYILNNFRVDAEGLMSMTHMGHANEICANIHSFENDSDLSITDAFAGVGANTIAFARWFRHVNAAEIDDARCSMLRNNLSLVGLRNASVFNGPYQFLMGMDIVAQDVIFFDPPWGENYKLRSVSRIHVTDSYPKFIGTGVEELESLIIRAVRQCDTTRYVVVKLPINYDLGYFEYRMREIGGTILTTYYNPPYSSIIKYVEVKKPVAGAPDQIDIAPSTI
jgi:predicted RNA methylase